MGYAMTYLNPLASTITIAFNNHDAYFIGLLSALIPLGGGLAAVLSYWLVNKISRRQFLMLSDLVGIIGTIITVIGTEQCLIIGRFLIGLSVGLNSTIISTYISEFCPPSLQGKTGVLQGVFGSLGVMAAFLFGILFQEPQVSLWRYPFLFPIVPQLIRSFMLISTYTLEPPTIVNKQNIIQYKSYYADDCIQELLTQSANKSNKNNTNGSIFDGLSHGIVLAIINQFLGISAVLFYSTKIFQQSTSDPQLITMLNLLIPINGTICAFGAGILLNWLSLMNILKAGILGCLGTLFILGYETSKAIPGPALPYIFGFLVFYSLSFGSLLPVALSSRIGAQGMCIVSIVAQIATAVVGQVFPVLLTNYGISMCFYMFALSAFIGFQYLQFVYPQDKKNPKVKAQ